MTNLRSIPMMLLPVLAPLGLSLMAFPQKASSYAPHSPTGIQRSTEAEWVGNPRSFGVHATSGAEDIHIVVGRSILLSTGSALRRVYVGDPKVLQSYSSGKREEVITARAYGVSTLILWDVTGARRVYNIFSDIDTEGLLKALQNSAPDAVLAVKTRGDRVSVEGSVSSDAAADTLLKLASTYTKNVVNGLKIVPPRTKQVQLKLRIIEVDRSRLEQFGINFFALGGSTLANTSTQQFANTVIPGNSASGTGVTVSDPLNLLLYNAKLNVGVTVKDLEQKQILQVLAEPTLTTMSGVPARFLSGGEFPLPVVQGGTGNSTAITIVFKPYGVKVDFTPTANPDGSIRLKVAPEVSALDYTNSVTVSGFTIPALSTRRAETEVELADGQSFVISGLLDHRTSDNLSRTPGIASVPILGQLFRSKGITHSVVELVVLVTATVVNPFEKTSIPELPKMVVPNMQDDSFDKAFPASIRAVHSESKTAGKEQP